MALDSVYSTKGFSAGALKEIKVAQKEVSDFKQNLELFKSRKKITGASQKKRAITSVMTSVNRVNSLKQEFDSIDVILPEDQVRKDSIQKAINLQSILIAEALLNGCARKFLF